MMYVDTGKNVTIGTKLWLREPRTRSVGSLVLTDRRLMFVTDVVNKSVELASVTSVSTDYNCVVGVVSSGDSDIKSPWVNMMVIATTSGEKDCLGLVPDDEELVQAVCIAMMELKTRGHEANPARALILNSANRNE